MSYLERNSRLLEEVRPLSFTRGDIRGKSTALSFYSLGSYHSSTLNQELYIGVKEPIEQTRIQMRRLRERIVFELAVMQIISEVMPHWLPRLPLFHGLLVDLDDQPKGILTEDFTKNGRNRVDSSMFPPEELKEIFVEGTVDDDFLCNVGFLVQPEGKNSPHMRYGDFYPLLIHTLENREKHKQKFPEDRVAQDIERYTIRSGIETS